MAILRALLGACLVVVAAASVHEAAVALGIVELGSVPGDGPPGDGLVGTGILALVAATVVAGVVAVPALVSGRSDRVAAALLALLDVASASFVLGRFFAYDPYYLPTLRRFFEGGNLGGVWIGLVVACLLVGAAVTARRPPAGSAMSVPLLLVAAVTVVLTGAGH